MDGERDSAIAATIASAPPLRPLPTTTTTTAAAAAPHQHTKHHHHDCVHAAVQYHHSNTINSTLYSQREETLDLFVERACRQMFCAVGQCT
jgi:hypothetical protein